MFTEMCDAIGEECITCHAWSSDGFFFGVCTEDGQVIVYKRGQDIVLSYDYNKQEDGDAFH